jgi:hypothetical protein
MAFSHWFASGWEGGGGSRQWEDILGIILLVYPVYCLVCAFARLSSRALLISGIIMHLWLAAYLGFCFADHLRYPGSQAPVGLTFPALIFAAIWFAHYRSVTRKELLR